MTGEIQGPFLKSEIDYLRHCESVRLGDLAPLS